MIDNDKTRQDINATYYWNANARIKIGEDKIKIVYCEINLRSYPADAQTTSKIECLFNNKQTKSIFLLITNSLQRDEMVST